MTDVWGYPRWQWIAAGVMMFVGFPAIIWLHERSPPSSSIAVAADGTRRMAKDTIGCPSLAVLDRMTTLAANRDYDFAEKVARESGCRVFKTGTAYIVTNRPKLMVYSFREPDSYTEWVGHN